MYSAKLALAAIGTTMFVASMSDQTSAQIYQHPGASYGPPVYSSPPQFGPPAFGGPPNSFNQEVYWGRFMPGRQWGQAIGNNLQNVNRWEYDPATGSPVYVQGQRWTNPLTGQGHGDVNVSRPNPNGTWSTTRQSYSNRRGSRGSQMPGRAVGR